MPVFREDPAFSHYTPQHLEIISGLRRGFFLLDMAEGGIFYLFNRPSQVARNVLEITGVFTRNKVLDSGIKSWTFRNKVLDW